MFLIEEVLEPNCFTLNTIRKLVFFFFGGSKTGLILHPLREKGKQKVAWIKKFFWKKVIAALIFLEGSVLHFWGGE